MTLEIGLVIRRDNEGLVRIPFCIGVGLALLAGPALAQKAERPEVKVGDRWQFVRYYSVASTKPNLTWGINSVTETEILGTENGEPLRMTPDLNVVNSPERNSRPPRHSAFRSRVGKSWRYATDWLFKPKGSMGSIVADVEVVAREKIAVPAGEFEAYKAGVEGLGQRHITYQQPIRRGDHDQRVVLYALAAPRTIVKSVTHNPYLGASTVELVAYQLRP